MNAFTIKDLENLSGVKAHTIRMWEQRYSFLKPQRTATNIRYYSCEELKSILNIALLNKYGFKISHIDRMCQTEMREKLITLSHGQAQQERMLNELLHYMVDLDMYLFEKLLNEQVEARGIDKTITQVIFPFLEKVGILWLTNNINPAQEHLVSNIIRQKIMAGIDACEPDIFPQNDQKSILLFLPEGEHHELALLYTHYLLKNRGVSVLYLGANVPGKDVEFVCNLKKPDFLYTHLTSIADNFDLAKFLSLTSKAAPDAELIVSGNLVQGYHRKMPANVQLKKSLPQVLEFISSI
ncbi:MAG: MerR family transcriptional regulator [Chitinophagaceae bacterium]|nr:MAG: MerR family transcriptional regulator [Chitinophagaceae bacterium]